ncbi:MAG TPA: glycosyl hydrolase family 28-related protein [Puia sp.]|nr:glycosyl hydrolase family 28-related protein [Puia sp.]
MGLFFLLLIRTFLFSAPPSLNVHDFGAKGDGVTDDTQAINQALQAAHDQQASVYFPSGTYLCNTLGSDGNLLNFHADGTQGLTIYGDGSNSVITTSLNQGSVMLFVLAFGPCSNLTVKDLSFQNTHGMITAQTRGLFFMGKSNQYITNLTVSGCYFNGFSTALGGQGINNWMITTNYFGSPQGHDNAKDDTDPAVFLWCYDNQNGLCNNVTITNNTADGYSGTGPLSALVTHRPMDGFVFGTAYGITITNNTTRHFAEEHYNLQPRATNPADTSTTLISNNYLDCSLPQGCTNTDGSPHRANYGIRCDISNAVITNNTLVNYTYGIIIRGIEYPNTHLHSYVITGNQLHAATDPTTYDVTAGILIQGNGNPVTDIRMTNNDIFTNLPDLPNNARSIRVERTQNLHRLLITNNNLHIIQ